MSQTFLDRAQAVGYDFEKKMLIVTLSDKMAQKMEADGWDVGHELEIGHFIQVSLEEGES
jgi:hypothetical protein